MSIRPFRPTDHGAVNGLHRAVWWPERSSAGWRWLDANPARMALGAPSGWVVEGPDGHAAAFIGNLIQRVWLGDRAHYAATGFSIIVPPATRGASRALINSVIAQPGIFVLSTLNANPTSAPLYARHGMAAWPSRTHAIKLSWRINTAACLHSRILRAVVRRTPDLIDPYRERFLSRRVMTPRPLRLPDGIEILSDLGDRSEYADFWTALKAEGRMIADRSPATLRWRLADPDQTCPPVLLAWRDGGGRIAGYALAQLAKATPIEPVVLEIIDLIALDREPQAIPALMSALIEAGRAAGAAKVRLQVVNDDLLNRLGRWVARARREGGWGHGHAVFRADGPDVGTWAPTPFDGDHGICQRPPPVPRAMAQGHEPVEIERLAA